MPTAANKDRGYAPVAENPGQQFGPYGQHLSATEAAVECFRTMPANGPKSSPCGPLASASSSAGSCGSGSEVQAMATVKRRAQSLDIDDLARLGFPGRASCCAGSASDA